MRPDKISSFSDSVYPANALVTEFGVDQGEAMKALDQEAEDIKERDSRARLTDHAALKQSYNRVRTWILEASEYMVKLEWEYIAHFVSSHRPACVWAILVGKALASKKAEPK